MINLNNLGRSKRAGEYSLVLDRSKAGIIIILEPNKNVVENPTWFTDIYKNAVVRV